MLLNQRSIIGRESDQIQWKLSICDSVCGGQRESELERLRRSTKDGEFMTVCIQQMLGYCSTSSHSTDPWHKFVNNCRLAFDCLSYKI